MSAKNPGRKPEKASETAPTPGPFADSDRDEMRNAPAHLNPDDLRDPRRADEALARWDELDPETRAALAADPHHGPRLEL